MEEVMLFASVLAPVVMALVQLVKQINMPKNIVPVVAVVIGLLVGLAAQPFTDFDWVLRLWSGGLAGLAATGLYQLIKPSTGYTKGGNQ
jgi:Bacteriophage A118-like holin, Hol118